MTTAEISAGAVLEKGRSRTLLAGFMAAHMSHHVSNSMLTPLLPLIRDSFALSYGQAGLLVSAFSLSAGLSNAPIGMLADRIGSRPVVVAGLLLTGVISAMLALSGAYWQLLVLLIILGLIAGSYHAPSAALIAQVFPATSRGAAMGLHITGGHLSFFATPLAAAALVSVTGTWRTPYLWLAFAPVLCGVILWYLTAGVRHEASSGAARLGIFREVWGVVQLVGPLVSFSILFQMVYMALFAFTTLYLVDARGFDPAMAAVLFAIPQLVGMGGAPLAGWLSDRLGRQAVILIGMVALGPALYVFTIVPNELILLPLLAIGLAAPMRQTVTEVLVTESAPAHRRATVLGAYYMLAQEVTGFGAPLLGLLAGLLGIGAAFGVTSLGLALCSVLVLVLYRRLR